MPGATMWAFRRFNGSPLLPAIWRTWGRASTLAAIGFPCAGRIRSLTSLPLLVATSRKSTIGMVLDDAPPEDRLHGTSASMAIAIANGADMIRVHDMAEMRDVARVADAITRGWP